jgi:hypothetical protein
MSCNGRVFEEIGKKMLQLKPLSLQEVDATDSVLGTYVNPPGVIGGAGKKGLTITYDALIKQAFPSKFWSSTKLTGDGYRQIEKNFSLFWGLSILLYEAGLRQCAVRPIYERQHLGHDDAAGNRLPDL